MVINYWLVGTRSRETSGWQSPAVGGGALIGRWGGDRRRKSSARGGGARGIVGAAADRLWGVVSGRAERRGGAGRPLAAGAGGSAGGGWRLGGVEFDDKLQALDFVSSGWKI